MGGVIDGPPDFKAIHKRAAEIVDTNPILAYAISAALRKRLVGRDVETTKHDLLTNLAYSAWNKLTDIQAQPNDPKYTVRMLNLVTDTLLIGYDILTESYKPNASSPRSPGK